MSELTSPDLPTDDEFDSFLKESAERDTTKLDAELQAADCSTYVQAALEEEGWLPLNEANERHQAEAERLYPVTSQWVHNNLSEYDFTPDGPTESDIELAIRDRIEDTIEASSQTESRYIEIITLLCSSMLSIQKEEPNAAAHLRDGFLRQTKMEVFSRMLVVSQLQETNPVVRAFNKIVPGPQLHADSEELTPYMLKALEEVAYKEEQERKLKADMEEANIVAGVEALSDEDDKYALESVVYSMLVLALRGSYSNEPNAAANREEELFRSAREHNLGLSVAQRLVSYFNQKYPIRYQL